MLGIGAALVVITLWRVHATRVKMSLIERLPKVASREELASVLRAYSRREGWIGTVAVFIALMCGLWGSWIGKPLDRPDLVLLVATNLGAVVVAAIVGQGLTRLEALIASRVYAAVESAGSQDDR